MDKNNKRRVVITGIGCITPIGNDVQTFWENALTGISGIDKITNFDASTFPSKIAGEVKNFTFTIDSEYKKYKKYLNRPSQLGLYAGSLAVADTRGIIGNIKPDRIGVGLGVSGLYPNVTDLLYYYKFKKESKWDYNKFLTHGSISPFWIFQQKMPSVLPSIFAKVYNCRGPNICTQSACASGSHAMGESFRIIQRGDADAIITGGADSGVALLEMTVFSILGALTTRKCPPEEASCPFDERRDGFVMSEGAAVLVFEELKHALKRGAHIYAEIIGFGSSLNAMRITDMPLDGQKPALAIKRALQDAEISPYMIDYINAHGTSTQQNDIAETAAIKNIFGECAHKIPITALKSMIGHLISGSGAIGLVCTILAHKYGCMPPTINLDKPDPYCNLDYIPWKMRKKDIHYALTNAFGFGGQNVSIVTKKVSS